MSTERLNQIQKMLETHSEDPFLHYASALEYEKLQHFAEARDILANLLIKQPDYLPTYYRLGQILEQLKNTEEAIETYQLGLKLAKSKGDFKSAGELTEALMLLDVFDE
jgi:tetratricopeptide (TPR) repeat protein